MAFQLCGSSSSIRLMGCVARRDSTSLNQANGSTHIRHRMLFDRVLAIGFAREPIFQHERGDTLLTKPLRQFITFVSQAKLRMAAARTDNDGGTRRLLGFARRQTLQTQSIDLVGLINGMRDLIASSLGPAIEINSVNTESQRATSKPTDRGRAR